MTFNDDLPTSSAAGILMPKFRNRFRITFQDCDPDNRPLVYNDPRIQLAPLTLQIVNFYVPTCSFEFPDSSPDYITLEYEDDILSSASKGVHNIGANKIPFDTIAEVLDSDGNAVEKRTYRGCQLLEVQQSQPLDYSAGNSEASHISFDPSIIVGNLVNDLENGEKIVQLLVAFFSSLKIVTNDVHTAPEIIRNQVVISYKTSEILFK